MAHTPNQATFLNFKSEKTFWIKQQTEADF